MLAASITNAREMHATPSRLHGVSVAAEARVSAFMNVASPTTIKSTKLHSLSEYFRPCGFSSQHERRGEGPRRSK